MDTRIVKRLKDPSLRDILQMVSDVTGVSCYDILDNNKAHTKARCLFAFHAYSTGLYTYGDIGLYLFRSNFTAKYWYVRHSNHLNNDVVYKHRSSTLATMINNCYI